MNYEKNAPNRNTIYCDLELLKNHHKLEFVVANKDNMYFWVINTNTVIMHVRKNKNIIIDYKVKVYNNEKECILPIMLSKFHFGVYRQKQRFYTFREWIKRTDKANVTIGECIIEMVTGYTREQGRREHKTIDHLAEIFNEKLKNIRYAKDEWKYSHKRSILINDNNDLDEFIEILKEDDRHEESRFLDDDK